ncbi:hypothetical protein EGJ00_02005 [Pseudomonas saudiphocaensis]|nr:hypothetical protein EGJ00_02005 [Pseudomonas saudiphocaensis]
MDTAIAASLNDGAATYLSATGAVLASGVEVIIDHDVERLDVVSGMLDRSVTITVRKGLLQPFDRKGAFRLAGKAWHIDGVAVDDGHWLTLYVVP